MDSLDSLADSGDFRHDVVHPAAKDVVEAFYGRVPRGFPQIGGKVPK
jgi:hypothetical protein